MRYKISKKILWKSVDDEMIIVDSNSDEYSYLNATASLIWQLIEKKYTFESMVEKLSSEYDSPVEKIRNDLTKLINDLFDAGLIEELE